MIGIMPDVCTRFAPSPSGFLHLGGARTALFNWLFSRHFGGKFLLRIEDTDRNRTSDEAIRTILEGLKWLGLDWDGDPVSQSANSKRHAEIARKLLESDNAYYCYASQSELAEMRAKAIAAGERQIYNGLWRDKNPSEAPKDVNPVIRFKAPKDGTSSINDIVQGKVTVSNQQLDDMILLRADGTPTYMLAAVVDDHDMSVTDIIRGDDHLNNAIRQSNLIKAIGWILPNYAHIPLIHGSDGTKLSKRHGATGVNTYCEMGYLPEAMRNYLLRLGWSHGNTEIISDSEAPKLFTLNGIGKSPARFDHAKLDSLNRHYIRNVSKNRLSPLVITKIEEKLDRELTKNDEKKLSYLFDDLRKRVCTIIELVDNSLFLFVNGLPKLDEKAEAMLNKVSRNRISNLIKVLELQEDWTINSITDTIRKQANVESVKLGDLAQPVRAALTGRTVSPGIFEIMTILGREESLKRLSGACSRQY